jgi:glycosyltransferase involved in cell wall biosynthesis
MTGDVGTAPDAPRASPVRPETTRDGIPALIPTEKSLIYICIPAHDEERTIGVLLWKVRKVMAEFGRDYELLVLNDASTDRTAEVLEGYRKVLPLRVLSEKERLGYPAALEKLIRAAVDRAPYPKRDVIVTLQGDFTESPEHIVPLVKAIEGGADVVAGCAVNGGLAPWPVKAARKAAPIVLGRVFRDAPVSDPLSGFRAYRVIVLKKALRDRNGSGSLLSRDGWAANIELLGVVTPHARRIEEAPVDLRYDLRVRDSRFRSVPTLRSLLRLRGHLDWPRESPTST